MGQVAGTTTEQQILSYVRTLREQQADAEKRLYNIECKLDSIACCGQQKLAY